MTKLSPQHVAALLLRSWWSHGYLVDVMRGSGYDRLDEDFPAFLPRSSTDYWHGRGKPRLTRVWVDAAWPELSAWLNRRKSIDELVPAIEQVVLLRPPSKDIRSAIKVRHANEARDEVMAAIRAAKKDAPAIEGAVEDSRWRLRLARRAGGCVARR